MRIHHCTSTQHVFQLAVAVGTAMILAIAAYNHRAFGDDRVITLFTQPTHNLVKLPDGSGTFICQQTTTGTPLMEARVPAIVGMDEAAFRVGDPAYWAENHLAKPSLTLANSPLDWPPFNNGIAVSNSGLATPPATTGSATATADDVTSPAPVHLNERGLDHQAIAARPPLPKVTTTITTTTTTIITRRVIIIRPAGYDTPVMATCTTTPVPEPRFVLTSLHSTDGRSHADSRPATPQVPVTSGSMVSCVGTLARKFFLVAAILFGILIVIAKVLTWLCRG